MDKIDLSLDDIIKINKKQKAKLGVKTQTKLKQFRANISNKKLQNKKNQFTSPLNRKKQKQVQQKGGVQNRSNFQAQTRRSNIQQNRQTKPNQGGRQRQQGFRSPRQNQQLKQNKSQQNLKGKIQRQQMNQKQGLQTRILRRNIGRRQQQNIQTRQAANQRIQRAARANVMNANRGMQALTTQGYNQRRRLNRNLTGAQSQQPVQQNQQRQRRWGRTSQMERNDGIITVNVQNDFMSKKRQGVNPSQGLQLVRVNTQQHQQKRQPPQRNSLQEEIRNLKPTVKQNFVFQRNDFNKGQTQVSLSERFSTSAAGTRQMNSNLRQVYL